MQQIRIPVIYYHSVAPKIKKDWSRSYLTLELKYFEEELKYFKKNRYKPLFLEDYYQIRKEGDNSRKKFIVLTFDDGFLDNYIYVYPLLKKYNFKATIFVNPEFVDSKSRPRHTLEDYWKNRVNFREIDRWGYLSWEEMRIMEQSGLVDIQSHTLTHTKYFVSDKLVCFHYPGRDCLYQIGNLYPERKPYCIEDENFEKLLPYGYPFFEEKSALIARKVEINPDFINEIIKKLRNFQWNSNYDFQYLFNRIKPIYCNYKEGDNLIVKTESESEYHARIEFELKESKNVIEKELNKEVKFCCWPHGDNNEFAHKTAIELGYKATTIGNFYGNSQNYERIDKRIGLRACCRNRSLTIQRTKFKIKIYQRINPYYTINKIYQYLKYGKLI